jgi:hypothetical protein
MRWHKSLGVQDPRKVYYLNAGGCKKERSGSTSGVSSPFSVNVVQEDHRSSFIIEKGLKDIKLYLSGILSTKMVPSLDCFSSSLHTSSPFLYWSRTFPVGIIFLLRIIKTEAVGPPVASRSRRFNIATRIVDSLQKFLYRVTSIKKSAGENFCYS